MNTRIRTISAVVVFMYFIAIIFMEAVLECMLVWFYDTMPLDYLLCTLGYFAILVVHYFVLHILEKNLFLSVACCKILLVFDMLVALFNVAVIIIMYRDSSGFFPIDFFILAVTAIVVSVRMVWYFKRKQRMRSIKF